MGVGKSRVERVGLKKAYFPRFVKTADVNNLFRKG
jgi:hypothetical protein